MNRFWFATQSFWTNYGNFKGRTSRSGYWLAALFLGLSGFLVNLIDIFALPHIGLGQEVFGGLGPLSTFYWFITVTPGLALMWRRMNDVGHSGWWAATPLGTGLLSYFLLRTLSEDFGGYLFGFFFFSASLVTFVFFFFFSLQNSQYGRRSAKAPVLAAIAAGTALSFIAFSISGGANRNPMDLQAFEELFDRPLGGGTLDIDSSREPASGGQEGGNLDLADHRKPGFSYECSLSNPGADVRWNFTGVRLVERTVGSSTSEAFDIDGVKVGTLLADYNDVAFAVGLRFSNWGTDMATTDFGAGFLEGWQLQGSDSLVYELRGFYYGGAGVCPGMIMPGESQQGFLWATIPPDIESVTLYHPSGSGTTFLLSELTGENVFDEFNDSPDPSLPSIGDSVEHNGVEVNLLSVTYSSVGEFMDGACVPGDSKFECDGLVELEVSNTTSADVHISTMLYFLDLGYQSSREGRVPGASRNTVQEASLSGVTIPAGSVRRFNMQHDGVGMSELRILVNSEPVQSIFGSPGGSYSLVGTFMIPLADSQQ
jgi:uncharacterized membrane protein YhaH (DUF805 family)